MLKQVHVRTGAPLHVAGSPPFGRGLGNRHAAMIGPIEVLAGSFYDHPLVLDRIQIMTWYETANAGLGDGRLLR